MLNVVDNNQKGCNEAKSVEIGKVYLFQVTQVRTLKLLMHLLGERYTSHFPNYSHFDLTGVLHVAFDLL